jgi:hypothetical protein
MLLGSRLCLFELVEHGRGATSRVISSRSASASVLTSIRSAIPDTRVTSL